MNNFNKERHNLYAIRRKMIARCHNPADKDYRNYGARGIEVCQRWKDSFTDFWNDIHNAIGPRKVGYSLDRVDNDGNYEPGNIRWATKSEQGLNTRSNHVIDHDGEKLPISTWARRAGIGLSTLITRLQRGWSMKEAITLPSDRTSRRFRGRSTK